MTDVFCKNCEYYYIKNVNCAGNIFDIDCCSKRKELKSKSYYREHYTNHCEILNKNNDCPDFKQKQINLKTKQNIEIILYILSAIIGIIFCVTIICLIFLLILFIWGLFLDGIFVLMCPIFIYPIMFGTPIEVLLLFFLVILESHYRKYYYGT